MSDVVECPECGKKTVVQYKEGVYQCLSCTFKRDFSESPKPNSKSDIGVLWVGLIAGLVAFFILQAVSTSLNSVKPEAKPTAAPAATQNTTYLTLDP